MRCKYCTDIMLETPTEWACYKCKLLIYKKPIKHK